MQDSKLFISKKHTGTFDELTFLESLPDPSGIPRFPENPSGLLFLNFFKRLEMPCNKSVNICFMNGLESTWVYLIKKYRTTHLKLQISINIDVSADRNTSIETDQPINRFESRIIIVSKTSFSISNSKLVLSHWSLHKLRQYCAILTKIYELSCRFSSFRIYYVQCKVATALVSASICYMFLDDSYYLVHR